MIYCPNCRTQLSDESNFCFNCGYKIQKQMFNAVKSSNVNTYYNPPGLTNSVNLPKEKSFTVSIGNSAIKNILKNNKDYHRRNVDAISEIESMIVQNERIIFALNGSLFIKRLSGQSVSYGYTTAINNKMAMTTFTESNGNYRNGVICLTDKRTIFVTNSNKMHSVRQFNNNEVTDIVLDKHFKTGALKIETKKDTFVLSILNYENAQKYKNHLEYLISNGEF